MIKLLAKLRPYLLSCVLLIASTLVGVYTDLYLPTYLADIINIGIQNGDKAFILLTGAKMLGCVVLGVVCTLVSSLLSARVSMGYGRDLRGLVFRKACGCSLAEFDRFGPASLITRTTNDINQIQMFMMISFRIVARAPLMIIGGVTMAYSKSTTLSQVVFFSVPLLVILAVIVAWIALPMSTSLQLKIDQVNRIMREKLTGIRVARAFGTEIYEEGRFDVANGDLSRTTIRMNRTMAVLMPGLSIILNFTQIALVWSGAVQIQNGEVMVGDVMAVVQYVMQIMMSFMMVTMVFIMLPRASASARRINEVLDVREAVSDPKKPAPETPQKGFVEFRNVTFCYGGATKPALKDISFAARPGETTAIIGSTGSGKTTLLNLITRFYDVTGGQVLVDGVDVREMPQKTLRSKIGCVPQKALLFRGTIADNIRYGAPEAGDEDVRRAAETAQAMEFISQKPEGLEAPVSQLGANLSGGQKQRVAIARAIVRHPEIYLFDDSFSALDAKTDQSLRTALKAYTREATVIIVAQKVSTILDADRIIVLDKGECVGMGTHQELCRSCQVYREIVYSQMSEEEAGL